MYRDPKKKILTMQQAIDWRRKLHDSGSVVVLTNGCFDVVHRGHVESLGKAAGNGDKLIVLLNSDRSVRELKGEHRPVFSETDRAYVLAGLTAVDAVVIFEGTRCENEIRALEPDIYAKGEEYREKQDPDEARALRDCGADVVWLRMVPGSSTTIALDRACRLACCGGAA